MIQQRLIREGEWLFRNRSYLPALPVVLIPLTMFGETYWLGSHFYQHVWASICLMISCVRLLIRVATVGCAPGRTSGRNTSRQVAATLNTTGLYSVVRHPLYVGNFLIWFGIAAYPRNWWFAAFFVLLFLLYYERIIAAEEDFLHRQFGPEYDEWASRTPIFVPRLSHWSRPTLPFSLRTVLRREYCAILGITFAYFLLDTLCHWMVEHRFHVDPSWTLLFSLGIVLFVVLRTLKKSSRLLHIVGR